MILFLVLLRFIQLYSNILALLLVISTSGMTLSCDTIEAHSDNADHVVQCQHY